jgi:hypothetical protein
MCDQPWPANGRVFNCWSKPVTVWSDTKQFYTIPAKSNSSMHDDVDHVQDVHGQWWKIGPGHAIVDQAGEVHFPPYFDALWVLQRGACRVSGPGKPCGQ